jgi:hypothetical protein
MSACVESISTSLCCCVNSMSCVFGDHWHTITTMQMLSITTLLSRSLICMGETVIGDLPMRSKVRHRWIIIHLARRLRLEPKTEVQIPLSRSDPFGQKRPPKTADPPKKRTTKCACAERCRFWASQCCSAGSPNLKIICGQNT